MLALHSASSPVSLMDELEKFIAFWCGPRRPEYGEPDETLRTLRLPDPLKRLYGFAGRWPPVSSEYAYVGHIFGVQDGLVQAASLKYLDDGKVIFLWENQGNWKCATLADGDDPPVWVDDWVGGSGEWLRTADSLARFLVSYCLQELLYGSRLCVHDPDLTRLLEAEARSVGSVAPLWIEGPYACPGARDHSFYLWRDSVLVWKGEETHAFAANNPEGVEYLNAHQGEIIELKVDLGPWTLNIRPDGSGEIAFYNAYDSTAAVPGGAYDFSAVRDRLLAASGPLRDPASRARVFFIRRGHAAFKALGAGDTELVRELHKRALQIAVNKQSDFDRLVKEHPPG